MLTWLLCPAASREHPSSDNVNVPDVVTGTRQNLSQAVCHSGHPTKSAIALKVNIFT